MIHMASIILKTKMNAEFKLNYIDNDEFVENITKYVS